MFYKFEAPEHWLQNIKNAYLKVTTLDSANDPFEFLPLSVEPWAQDALEEWRQGVASECGVICLTSKWGHPLMWAHYAQKHQGVCLGFSTRYHGSMRNVVYGFGSGEMLPPALAERRSEESKPTILSTSTDLLYRKSKDWGYEGEIRKRVNLKNCEVVSSEGHELYFHKLWPSGKSHPWFVLEEVTFGLQSSPDAMESSCESLTKLAADDSKPFVSGALKLYRATKSRTHFQIERSELTCNEVVG